MNIDIYTKFVLTVIASALVWIITEDFPKNAHAQQLSLKPVHFAEQYSYRSLARNGTFKRAVKRIVENCSVDQESISC